MIIRAPHKSPGYCGSVGEELVRVGNAEYYARTKGTTCRDCERLKNVRRSCLRCGKHFQPGCKAPWHCERCKSSKADNS